jgi:hypothetical protein
MKGRDHSHMACVMYFLAERLDGMKTTIEGVCILPSCVVAEFNPMNYQC